MMVVHFIDWFIFARPRRDSWGGSSRAHARASRLVGASMSGFSPACVGTRVGPTHTAHGLWVGGGVMRGQVAARKRGFCACLAYGH